MEDMEEWRVLPSYMFRLQLWLLEPRRRLKGRWTNYYSFVLHGNDSKFQDELPTWNIEPKKCSDSGFFCILKRIGWTNDFFTSSLLVRPPGVMGADRATQPASCSRGIPICSWGSHGTGCRRKAWGKLVWQRGRTWLEDVPKRSQEWCHSLSISIANSQDSGWWTSVRLIL